MAQNENETQEQQVSGYRKAYERGWRASARYAMSSSYQVFSPLERADMRGEPAAWYDGYLDMAAGRPKWHSYPAPTFTDDDHSSDGGFRYPVNHGPDRRPTTVKPAGPFGGNSQSGLTAQHGTQSGYVMHRRAAQAEHDAAGPEHAGWCAGPVTHQTACQPCKDAHAAYVRDPYRGGYPADNQEVDNEH